MSPSHEKCPFCSSYLKMWKSPKTNFWINYSCDNEECRVDDMPRYQINFEKTEIMSYQFMIDSSYVSVNYEDNTTIISKLDVCILFDKVILPRVIYFNMYDLGSVSEKVKTLLLFS